jgi:Nickel responsive protein SCO4226-like
MSKFLNVHSLDNRSDDDIRKLEQLSPDEFDVKHLNMFYNIEMGICFCLDDAPNREAIVKHHEKHGFKCDWITEVKTTA